MPSDRIARIDHPDLVIFDNDGVLVDSEDLANEVLAGLLTSCGYPITRDESVQRFMGGTIGGIRSLVEAEIGVPLPDDFEQRYHDGVLAGFRAGLRPVPGVAAVLDHLDRHSVAYCVASSGTHERIRLALSIVGLLDRFAGPSDRSDGARGRGDGSRGGDGGGDDRVRIFSAEDVARGKPAPDLFLHAAARSGVAPERCLVVEDSPAGVAAGRAAAMRVVGYAAMTPAERLATAGADAIVTSMAELPAVLRRFVAGDGQTGV